MSEDNGHLLTKSSKTEKSLLLHNYS